MKYPIFKVGDRVRMTPDRAKIGNWSTSTMNTFGPTDRVMVVVVVENYDRTVGSNIVGENKFVFVDWNPTQAHGPEHLVLVKKPTVIL